MNHRARIALLIQFLVIPLSPALVRENPRHRPRSSLVKQLIAELPASLDRHFKGHCSRTFSAGFGVEPNARRHRVPGIVLYQVGHRAFHRGEKANGRRSLGQDRGDTTESREGIPCPSMRSAFIEHRICR